MSFNAAINSLVVSIEYYFVAGARFFSNNSSRPSRMPWIDLSAGTWSKMACCLHRRQTCNGGQVMKKMKWWRRP
jgi:hypothetical protein